MSTAATHGRLDALRPAPARRAAYVASVGTALPRRPVSSADLATRLGVSEHWIVKRTGVHERYYAGADEPLSQLAARAARAALDRTELSADELDLVLVATCSQDDLLPNAAPVVAGAIGASRAGAVDIGAACTGFLSGLVLGSGVLESGRVENVLLVGAEVLSRYLDPDDVRTTPLFGDGAGAVVMRATDGPGGIGRSVLGADATGADYIRVPREPPIAAMQGQEVFKHAVPTLVEMTLRVLAANDLDLSDIDLFVYHQANRRITWAVAERLELAPEQVVDVIGRTGNTSAASIPLALAAAEESGQLTSGARVLVAAIGSGLTFGATVLEWT